MTTIGNINTTTGKVIFMLAFAMLSCVKSFAQTAPTVAASGDNQSGAQMELVSWLMATKQAQMGTDAKPSTSTNETGKKQFINSGLSTSRILNRTFLKKAMSRETNVA